MAVLIQAVLGFLWVPMAGRLSDRIGRKNMYYDRERIRWCLRLHLLCVAQYQSAEFDLHRDRDVACFQVMTCYGPQAALIAESFTPRLRYSGYLARLSARLDHRRRSLAVYRDRAVRHV